jgi:hypothetical protein
MIEFGWIAWQTINSVRRSQSARFSRGFLVVTPGLTIKDRLRVLQPNDPDNYYGSRELVPGTDLLHRSLQYSATPMRDNPAQPLQRSNPNGLQDELIRHLKEDSKMSAFDFALQFLDTNKMTYWGKCHDANFWIENASLDWNEVEAPFHTVARLTLLPKSHLQPDAADKTYIDVTGHSFPESTPLGSMNRARWAGEVASRKARMCAASNRTTGYEPPEISGQVQQGGKTEENTRQDARIRAAS